MPTIFIKFGFRFFFYSADGVEPKHVHIEYGEATAKFWLSPIRLAYSYRMKAKDIKKCRIIIENNIVLMEEEWNAYFSKKK